MARELKADDGPAGVLLVMDQLSNPHAGTEGQVLTLVAELQGRGIRCALVVLHGSAYIRAGHVPCPVIVLGRRRVSSLATWWAMWRIGRRMARQGFSVAQTFMIDASVVAPPMLRLAGIRTFVSRRDLGYWYTPEYRAILRLTRRVTSGYICNSEAVAREARRHEGVPEERCRVVYNGLLIQKYGEHKVPELEYLKNSGVLLVGLVANIRPIKRIGDLIEAIALLGEGSEQVQAVVIGAGDPAPLRSKATELGLEGRVHFLGSRSDVHACLRHLDIGVLCSESEGFSNTLLEYMGAGLPSVCTDAGGNPEAIRHGETGLLYPVGDTSALSRSLASLIREPEMRKRMGAQAREEAATKYSIDAMVSAHMHVYREASRGT